MKDWELHYGCLFFWAGFILTRRSARWSFTRSEEVWKGPERMRTSLAGFSEWRGGKKEHTSERESRWQSWSGAPVCAHIISSLLVGQSVASGREITLPPKGGKTLLVLIRWFCYNRLTFGKESNCTFLNTGWSWRVWCFGWNGESSRRAAIVASHHRVDIVTGRTELKTPSFLD